MSLGLPLSPDLALRFSEEIWAEVAENQIVDWIRNRPAEPVPITRAERVEGLSALWLEAKRCFAYWDQVPDLDWDGAFRTYLDLVNEADSPASYYDLLKRFVALLQDGHSYVVPPAWVSKARARPRIRIYPIDGEAVVLTGEGLPSGAVITAVDGRPVCELLTTYLPTQSASTDSYRELLAVRQVLEGPCDEPVRVAYRLPNGQKGFASLNREEPSPLPILERMDLPGGLVLLRINSWADAAVLDRFNEEFPDFDGVAGLIIDLRSNTGGNSMLGQRVLARLIETPVPGLVQRSPLLWPQMSWCGADRLEVRVPEEPLQPDTARPRFLGPIALLTSRLTYSAAEDFAAQFRLSGRGLIIGDRTGGSTGNPTLLPLPGGGFGAICAARTEYPDGSTYVGSGVEPHILCPPTAAGFAAGRDEMLERAIEELTRKA